MHFTMLFKKWMQRILPFAFQKYDSPALDDKEMLTNVTCMQKQPQKAKYLLDPMRTTTCPDVLGEFYDPMGGRTHYAPNYDLTNTGA
ncbi:hypothetical protein [Absidia glauca]|uniref:Uncharacterized protein n=1 Tax=Absidia glauca TaxID=4829 RepID=A0A168LIF6_ABSGL|nr:hypothetical protein [Absidia glauca]